MKKKAIYLALLACVLTACKKEQELPQVSHTAAMETNNLNMALQASALNNWMGGLPDSKAISGLSIPGTHDSGALVEPVSGTAKCQNIGIADQLNIGVRYLDIRCRHIDNGFAIHHGAIYQNLNFQDVINACISFLNANPTETILMSVKEEHTPSNNTRSFEQTFDTYIQQNASKWDLTSGIGNLGALRGKIKLVRRFGAASAKGIDATAWADNTTFDINNSFGGIRIQDLYQVNNLAAKWTAVKQTLNAAKNDSSAKLYINYSSGYQPGIFSIPNINAVANYINPRLVQYFSGNGSGKYGMIAMDFVDQSKSQLIVNTNF